MLSFRTITVDYTIEFARVLRRSSPEAAFSFLSGRARTRQAEVGCLSRAIRERRRTALLAAGFPRVYVFRPAYIYPVEPRKEPNFSYRLLRAIYPAFRLLFPNQVIRADDLARAMVRYCRRENIGAGKLRFSRTETSGQWSARSTRPRSDPRTPATAREGVRVLGRSNDTKPSHLGPGAPWAQRGRTSLHDDYLSAATEGHSQPYSA